MLIPVRARQVRRRQFSGVLADACTLQTNGVRLRGIARKIAARRTLHKAPAGAES